MTSVGLRPQSRLINRSATKCLGNDYDMGGTETCEPPLLLPALATSTHRVRIGLLDPPKSHFYRTGRPSHREFREAAFLCVWHNVETRRCHPGTASSNLPRLHADAADADPGRFHLNPKDGSRCRSTKMTCMAPAIRPTRSTSASLSDE